MCAEDERQVRGTGGAIVFMSLGDDSRVMFKSHPEGVVSVEFKAAELAQQCVQMMNGR